MLFPIPKDNVQGLKKPGGAHMQNQDYLNIENLKGYFKMKRAVVKVPIIVTTIMMKNMMK